MHEENQISMQNLTIVIKTAIAYYSYRATDTHEVAPCHNGCPFTISDFLGVSEYIGHISNSEILKSRWNRSNQAELTRTGLCGLRWHFQWEALRYTGVQRLQWFLQEECPT